MHEHVVAPLLTPLLLICVHRMMEGLVYKYRITAPCVIVTAASAGVIDVCAFAAVIICMLWSLCLMHHVVLAQHSSSSLVLHAMMNCMMHPACGH